jgi:hypothetical protein
MSVINHPFLPSIRTDSNLLDLITYKPEQGRAFALLISGVIVKMISGNRSEVLSVNLKVNELLNEIIKN